MPKIIRFDPDDLIAFADASYDRNPLHVSVEYSRKSPFGEPVVFGILGLLKAIAGVEGLQPLDLSGATVDFRGPLFMGVDYFLEVGEVKKNQVTVAIVDAGRRLLTATLRYLDAGTGRPGVRVEGQAPRVTANRLGASDLLEGFEVAGRYAPEPSRFGDLLERCGLPACGNSQTSLATLLLLSYLVGMELPGERAIFSRFKFQLKAEPGDRSGGPLEFVARVDGYHEVYDRLEISLSIAQSGEPFGSASISTGVRPDSPAMHRHRIAELLPPSDRLRGRAALVIGGSRGLGAALVTALASQGCDIWLNYRTSRDEADALIAGMPPGYGLVRPAPGDASDQAWNSDLGSRIEADGGLDFLFCNAVPAIRPLRFALASMDRLRRFIDESLTMVANPLAAFGPMIEASGGWCVVTSSSYASGSCEDLPPDLHHYVAAKRAVEGLVSSLSPFLDRSRFLVARPPRLLTDQTNSRAARVGAIAVEDVAASIIARLLRPEAMKKYAIMDEFRPAALLSGTADGS
jgi:NAD(P)-dependent dehydrogenase (short-subunit alcohol dehydrogenase family)